MDSAYNQSLERIKILERENEMLKEKLKAIASILDNSESDEAVKCAPEQSENEPETASVQEQSIIQEENKNEFEVNCEFDNLKEEINSLKNFLKHS